MAAAGVANEPPRGAGWANPEGSVGNSLALVPTENQATYDG